MKSQLFDQKIFSSLESPMQKLMELNVKMMQNLSYIKPLELMSVKKPEELFEKQMELFVQNSHLALNYMRETFNVLESHWLDVSRNMDKNTKKHVSEASTTLKKRTASTKKRSSNIKKSALTTKTSSPKSAKSSPKKSIKVQVQSNVPKTTTLTDKKLPLAGGLTDKHLGIHNLGKNNPFPR